MAFLLTGEFWAAAAALIGFISAVVIPWLSDRNKKKREERDLAERAEQEDREALKSFHERVTKKVHIDELRKGMEADWNDRPESES